TQTAAAPATKLAQRLDRLRLPHPITLPLNGSPNSGARTQTADLGLKGPIIPTAQRQQAPASPAHAAGGPASTASDTPGLSRTARGLKIAADDLSDYVEKLVRRFLDGRSEAETFSEWAHRVDEEELK